MNIRNGDPCCSAELGRLAEKPPAHSAETAPKASPNRASAGGAQPRRAQAYPKAKTTEVLRCPDVRPFLYRDAVFVSGVFGFSPFPVRSRCGCSEHRARGYSSAMGRRTIMRFFLQEERPASRESSFLPERSRLPNNRCRQSRRPSSAFADACGGLSLHDGSADRELSFRRTGLPDGTEVSAQ